MASLSGSRAATWANATSLTSAIGMVIFGIAGNSFFIRRDIISTLSLSFDKKEGP